MGGEIIADRSDLGGLAMRVLLPTAPLPVEPSEPAVAFEAAPPAQAGPGRA